MEAGTGVIQTVTGRVSPDALGITYTHEHLLCDQRRCRPNGLRRPGGEGNLMVLDDVERQRIRAIGARAGHRSRA